MFPSTKNLKKYRPDLVKDIIEADKQPPEHTSTSVEEMLEWLDKDDAPPLPNPE
jgi:hypothetical protein